MKRLLRRILFGALLSAGPAGAHSIEQIFGEFRSDEDGWRIESLFDAGYALPQMRDDPDAPAPERDWLVSLSAPEHAELRIEAERYLHDYLDLRIGDEPVTWQARFPDWDTIPPAFPTLLNDGAYFRVLITGTWPAPPTALRCALPPGDHPNLVLDLGGEEVALVWPGEHAEFPNPRPAPQQPPRPRPRTLTWTPVFLFLVIASALALHLHRIRRGR
jgi:hypothetical protein